MFLLQRINQVEPLPGLLLPKRIGLNAVSLRGNFRSNVFQIERRTVQALVKLPGLGINSL